MLIAFNSVVLLILIFFHTLNYPVNMSSSDEDTVPLARVDSGPKRFSKVPYDTLYQIRVIGTKKYGFEYLLKKDKPLPYETELSGRSIS